MPQLGEALCFVDALEKQSMLCAEPIGRQFSAWQESNLQILEERHHSTG